MSLLERLKSSSFVRLGVAVLGGFGLALLVRKTLGVRSQEAPPRRRADEMIPPWPQGDEEDPLEETFGPSADEIRLLTPEELAELRRGARPPGVPPQPDLTRPGDLGAVNPSLPSTEWPYRMTWRMADGTWKRIGVGLPPCGQLWILDFDYFVPVPGCAGLNYARPYRATLLRAFAEAFRHCRERDQQCPDAQLWMLSAHWGCVIDGGRPVINIYFKLAVACVAS